MAPGGQDRPTINKPWNTAVNPPSSSDAQFSRSVLRLSGALVGLAFGLAAGLVLFAATNILVLRGGQNVGAHLSLVSQFFPGYSVTFAGSFVGFAYASLTGFAAGWLTSWIYNRVALFRAS